MQALPQTTEDKLTEILRLVGLKEMRAALKLIEEDPSLWMDGGLKLTGFCRSLNLYGNTELRTLINFLHEELAEGSTSIVKRSPEV